MEILTPRRPERWAGWLNWWTCICLPAVGFAFIMWGARITFYATTGIALLTTLVLMATGDQRRNQEVPWRERIVITARISGFAVVAVFALTMLAQVSGSLWLLMLALMVATSPPATRLFHRATASMTKQASPVLDGEELTPGTEPPPPSTEERLDELTDVELCYLWRHSFWDLESAPSAAERSRIVLHRQRILDELTTRNNAAVAAWLASGARASSSPERFFTDGDSGQPAAA